MSAYESNPVAKAVEVLIPVIREASDLDYDDAKQAVMALIGVLLANKLTVVHVDTSGPIEAASCSEGVRK